MKSIKNKKAVSDMVSYVLLIVIALSIAGGVYSWMRFYVPSNNESQKCSDDAAISITNYQCINKLINLTIENKGYFTIDGFFIRGSDNSSRLPIVNLNTTDPQSGFMYLNGRYDIPNRFKPGAIMNSQFDYAALSQLKRIQIQPYLIGKKGELLTCSNIIDMNLEGC